MGLLRKSQLLEKEKLEVVKVDLSEDEFVYVREMTGRERDNFERSLTREIRDKKGKVTDYEGNIRDFRAKLAVCTVCDEEGKLLLDPKDFDQLSQSMRISKLEKIVEAAQKLNAISEEDKEDMVKNLEAVPDGNSSSDSAKN
jgi:hypothetical protein